MTTFRSTCPISSALDVVGDRWTLLVVRDLMVKGKRTFTELSESDEHIATNVLAARLQRLTDLGCVERSEDPDDGRRYLYRLTPMGARLGPVLIELARWGHAQFDHTDFDEAYVALADGPG